MTRKHFKIQGQLTISLTDSRLYYYEIWFLLRRLWVKLFTYLDRGALHVDRATLVSFFDSNNKRLQMARTATEKRGIG